MANENANARGQRGQGGGERRGRDDRRGRDNREEKSQYLERVVTINRVAKVHQGGRRFSFTALVVVGDGDGTVGVGYGKAKEVPAAIAKGVEEAKKQFFKVPRIQGTIPHPVQGEAAAGVVMLRPASPGTGVIAGGPVRAVLECAGIHDVLSKSLGSDNAINIVHATVEALRGLERPEAVAARRGLPVDQVAPAAMLRAQLRKLEKLEAPSAEQQAERQQLAAQLTAAEQLLASLQSQAPAGPEKPAESTELSPLKRAKIELAMRRAELKKAEKTVSDDSVLMALRNALADAEQALHAAEDASGKPAPELVRTDKQPLDEATRALKTEVAFARADLRKLERDDSSDTDALAAARQRLAQAERQLEAHNGN